MNTIPTTEARQPGSRLALVSFGAGVSAVVAVPLSIVLQHLALATWPPPNGCPAGVDNCLSPQPLVSRLLMTLGSVVTYLLIAGLLTAIIAGHLALIRLRHQGLPGRYQRFALWGVILGYAVPLLVVAYVAWGLSTGALGE